MCILLFQFSPILNNPFFVSSIADARRSFQIASPQKDQDLIWKQVTTTASRGIKRPRKSSASNRDVIHSDSEDDTASRAANKTPRKRPRASVVGSSPKKSMSKLTKSEVRSMFTFNYRTHLSQHLFLASI